MQQVSIKVLDEGEPDLLIIPPGEVCVMGADEAANILRFRGGEIVGDAPDFVHDALREHDDELAARHPVGKGDPKEISRPTVLHRGRIETA